MSGDQGEVLTVSTKERPSPYDGLVTAKPGEPVFILQGGDPFAPPTVLHWANLARAAGMAETNERRAAKLLRKATDAEQAAWAMQAYQRNEVEVAPQRASYNDHVEVEADAERDERGARIAAAAKLHNVLAGAAEVGDVLAGRRILPEAEVMIREAVTLLTEAANLVEPRRGNERS